MKKLMSVLLAACMLVGLVACSNPAENPPASSADSANVSQGESSGAESEELEGKLVFWTTWSETETQGVVFQEMCDAFTELHPKVEIELQFYGRELGNVLNLHWWLESRLIFLTIRPMRRSANMRLI